VVTGTMCCRAQKMQTFRHRCCRKTRANSENRLALVRSSDRQIVRSVGSRRSAEGRPGSAARPASSQSRGQSPDLATSLSRLIHQDQRLTVN
jgi:hypothetical protein